MLVTPTEGPIGRRRRIAWSEAAALPLSLLTPDMQNRRILNGIFRGVGVEPNAVIETNSVATLWSHLRLGRWSAVMPQTYFALFGQVQGLSAVPLAEPEVTHIIGLATADREPLLPVTRAMLDIAGATARQLPKTLAVA